MRQLLIMLGVISVVGVSLGLLLGSAPSNPISEVLVRLLFGWWSYLARVGPKVTVSRDGLISSLACLLIFAVGLHLFLRWMSREVSRARGTTSRPWKARWTGSIVAVVILMFAAGIGATGLAHQSGWILSSSRPKFVPRLEPFLRNYRISNRSLIDIAIGVSNYESVNDAIPIGLSDAKGRRVHSWQTSLLPFISGGYNGTIREDLPWNNPQNSAYFRGIVPEYLNPDIGALRTSEGYALGHYAGNVHLLGGPQHSPIGPFLADSANTIVAGEVATAFKAWGDPTNLRDPEPGINRSPSGFGSPSPDGGCNFLFLDGSVRFVKDSVDPKVLQSISRPSKGQEP